jgi:hypothetical protein
MPSLPIDFSNTVIYRIVCNDLSITECYVGHTTDFIRRKYAHKRTCNKEGKKSHTIKLYATINDTGGWDNWSMVEIEKYPCNSSNEACSREREWFERLGSSLNMISPQTNRKDYMTKTIKMK